jgi:hypothetical protein
MRNKPLMTRARKNQGGYALLLVVFLTALLVVGTMSIGLRILTEGRRQRELEMIWRGQQYTRGIKLYYRKLGRFPTSLEDLTTPKIGNIRFMRQAYKDPMNTEDGSWRLIYVGPAGQLIGSLNPSVNKVQMPSAAGQPGGTSTNPGTPAAAVAQGTSGSTPGATGTGTAAQGTDTTGTDPQAVPMGDTPTIVGGSVIGIGSKINQPSIIVFEKAHNYRLFEFILDPSKDLTIGGVPQQIGPPTQNTPGTQPPQPNPLNPPPSPPTTVPNPNPTQQ